MNTLKSYYNAVNRKEYERVQLLRRAEPSPDLAPPYPQFVEVLIPPQ